MARLVRGHIVIFIVSNIAPYGYEINNIIGLPLGIYRFRYDQAWFVLKDPYELKGQDGLVVMRDVETATFYPLRRVIVERVTRVGDIYHIDYTLGKMIDWASNEAKRKAQIEKFTDLLNRELDVPNKPGEYITKSVLLSSDHAHFIHDEDFHGEEADRELNSWGTIARVLANMKFYKDFDFFRLVQFVDERGRKAQVKRGLHGDLRFLLSPNTTYHLNVFQRALFSSPLRSAVERKRDLVLGGVPDETTGIRLVQHIVGKYDLLNFSFKTSPKAVRKDSFLLLEVRYENPTVSNLLSIPPMHIPIYISPPKSFIVFHVINLIFFIMSVYLLFFTEQFLSQFGIAVAQSKIDLIQRLAILLMVLTGAAIGGVAKTLVSLIGLSVSSVQSGKKP